MKINFYLILTVLCTSTCLHASQVVQKEVAEGQHHATQFELQMIEDAETGRLTETTLQQYLKQDADINAKRNDGSNALILASYNGHTDVVQQLIDARADINTKDSNGTTALILASYNDQTDVVQKLIAADADIDAKNIFGLTALMLASANGRTAAVQQLIAAHADINAKNNNGRTALILASLLGQMAIVQQLIAAGADHTIANEKDNNKTAREYAPDKDAYDKAVAAGLQERKEYLARQPLAKQIVAEQATYIPGLQDIIMGYAYGPSPMALPPTKSQEEEKKSDSAQAVLETAKNKKEKKSNCAVQ